MQTNFKNIMIAASAISIIAFVASCTKADYGDDFVKGDPPPVPGGFVNSADVASGNLVGHWAFNGDLKDAVSSTNAVGTNTSFGTGVKGQAMRGALNGYALAVPSNAVKTMTSYTISWWVNSPLNVGATGLVSFANSTNFWGNFNSFFENGGTSDLMRFKVLIDHTGTVFDLGIQEQTGRWNAWSHFAVTYDGVDKFVVYLNGNPAATVTRAGLGPAVFTNFSHIVFGTFHFMTNPSLTSGSGAQGWAGYLTGMLDEVRIYNKALSALEVKAIQILERQGR
jgi:hypothetical protein